MKIFALPSAFLAVLLLFVGCMTTPTAKKPTADESQQRVQWLERDLRRKETALQELRERNLILERRIQAGRPALEPVIPVAFDPSAGSVSIATPPPATPKPVSAPAVRAAAVARPPQKLPAKISAYPSGIENEAPEAAASGEQMLYSKVIETYRRHDMSEIQKALQLLLKTYPDSVYADNALYVTGLLAFESNDLVRANHYMNRVVRDYPNGNKAVSALFAIAMVEKRRQKFAQAQSILKSVQKIYPGSPEAARAGTESKLIQAQSSKTRGEG